MSFNSLPPELRFQIFEHVAHTNNTQPPSLYKFAEEPTFDLTSARQKSLKNASLVCKSWRALTAPLLFRHSRIVSLTSREDLESLEQAVIEYCDFARHQQLSGRGVYEYVSSLTVVTDSAVLAAAWPGIRSNMDGPDARHVEIVADIWHDLFDSLVNLENIIVVAPVVTMAALLSTCEQTTETWVFNMPCHYLRLSIDPMPRGSKSLNYRSWQDFVASTCQSDATKSFSSIQNRLSSPLVHAKDWRYLAYNEGAMISVYSHYEWQWKVPPKILRSLLGQFIKKIHAAEIRGHTSAGLRSIEYISLFPLANHIEATFIQEGRSIFDARQTNNVLIEADDGTGQHLGESGPAKSIERPTFPLHKLERFTLRLGDSDLLTDKRRMGHSDRTDCWSEWENCYRLLMSKLLTKLPQGAILRTLGGKEIEYAVEDVLSRYREETRVFKTMWKKRWADGLIWDKIETSMHRIGAENDENIGER